MEKKTRVLMFRTHDTRYDPRVRSETESLLKKYDVSLIEWDRDGDRKERETVYGIDVIRVKNNFIMRLIPYDIFRLRFWWKEAYKVACKIYEENPFQVVHCHDLDTLPIGVMLKDRYNIKLIYDAAEVWTYMIEGDVPKFLIKRFEKLEKKLIKKIDAFITVDEGYRDYFASLGYSKNKIKIVKNAKKMLTDEYVPTHNEVPIIIYLGKLRENRMVLELIEAVKGREDIKALIGGAGPLSSEIEERVKHIKNIDFVGRVPMDEVIKLTLKTDIVYCMFDPKHPLTRIGSPNKFFEAVVAGRALLASEGTYVGKLVKELKCGFVTEPNLSGIKKAVDFLAKNPDEIENMGRNALKAAKSGYNWEAQEKVLFSVYKEILR